MSFSAQDKSSWTDIDRAAYHMAQADFETAHPDTRLSFQRYLEMAYEKIFKFEPEKENA